MSLSGCPNCGMYIASHPLVWEPGEEPYAVEGPMPHECPEPYSRQTAELLAAVHGSTGIPVSARMKARIEMGLRQ